jgi:hypothetical protein
MSRHTPGPWGAITNASCGYTIQGDGWTLCEVDLLPDARLIAAAPELLEALEGLLNALPSATTHPAIKAARAAIAKAKGEE